MFDFHNLRVYKKAKIFNKNIFRLLRNNKRIERSLKDQFQRASVSIMINIAEGTGRATRRDRCNFYTISRASLYECVSLIDILHDLRYIDEDQRRVLYRDCEDISKMLLGLINSQN